MNYDSYIGRIDLVIEELNDLKCHLKMCKGEEMAGRCPPVRGIESKILECIPGNNDWTGTQIQGAFDAWMNRIRGLLGEPPA